MQVGYYKVHPEIPEELSACAKNFILLCFTPDPDKRATAAELLDDPFLAEYVHIFVISFDSNYYLIEFLNCIFQYYNFVVKRKVYLV